MIGLFDVPVFEMNYQPPTPKPVFDTMVRVCLFDYRFQGVPSDDLLPTHPPIFSPFAALGSAADLVRRFGERKELEK